MKTSANRSVWTVCAAVGLLFACEAAHASLIRVTYEGTAQSFGNASIDPSAKIRASFVVDTGFAKPTLHFSDADPSWLWQFDLPIAVEDFRFSANEKELFAFGSLAPAGYFAGDLWASGPDASGRYPYQATLRIDQGPNQFLFSFDGSTLQGLTAEAYSNSEDPLGDLLVAQDGMRFGIPGFTAQVIGYGDWGRFTADVESLSVHRVPEPTTLALLVCGLAAIYTRRKTLKVAPHRLNGN